MILDQIVADKKKRLLEHKKKINDCDMKAMALNSNRTTISFYSALKKEGLSIIGEFKNASPSTGIFNNTIDFTERIEQYNDSVDAISCLTEEDYFNGSIEYLKEIRKISNLPILRKDFIIEEYQIYEAKVIGADAILLIVAILDDEKLDRFYQLAMKLNLDVLVEVHDEEEMRRALHLDAKIIGVNNRNLKDFTISLEVTKRLQKLLPEGKVFISESGITTGEDILFLKDCNIDGVLIGKALMESEVPKETSKKWKKYFN